VGEKKYFFEANGELSTGIVHNDVNLDIFVYIVSKTNALEQQLSSGMQHT